MVECGYTWDYIDREMTIPKLNALVARWNKVPPLTSLVAGIASVLGVKWDQQSRNEADEAELLAQAKRDAMLMHQGR